MIIVIEGIDGAGKTTIAKHIARILNYTYLAFPDRTTPIGGLIDMHLKMKSTSDPNILAVLFLLNRREWNEKLKTGNYVLDRYTLSGYIYGQINGANVEMIKYYDDMLPKPDISIFMDISVDDALSRKSGVVAEKFENKEFLESADKLFRLQRYDIVVDAMNYKIDDVMSQIRSIMEPRHLTSVDKEISP